MTMLGCTVLHEIVNIEGVREDAARILKFMHRAISNVLKQDRSENHDGMDITLVIFEKDFSNRQVSLNFAGAKASMSYIQAGELCTLSGDRQFLGGETLRREFTNHYLTLPADTCFYFYTDGYKDQNDARRKKIGHVFKDVLLQYYQQPMPRQLEAMSELLDGHQLGVRQRDDITLIGLRLFS
jgi:serine phosphatase RsbU (regulator of sigma subunit)